MPRGEYVTPEEICEDIQRLAEDIGRPPRSAEYDRLGRYAYATVKARFGSWVAAVEAAGFEDYDRYGHQGGDPKYADLSPEDLGLTPVGERPE